AAVTCCMSSSATSSDALFTATYQVSCDIPPDQLVELREFEDCLANSLEKRGEPKDSCLIDCLRSRKGESTAGGCFHVCNYPMQSGQAPVGWRDCKLRQSRP